MEENNVNIKAPEAIETPMEELNGAAAEPIAPPLEVFELSKKDKIFALLLCIVSISLSAFGIFGELNIGWTVTSLILAAIGTVYLGRSAKVPDVFGIICLQLSVLLSCIFAVTSNGSVRFFGFIVSILLNLGWFASRVTGNSSKGDLGLFQFIFKPVFGFGFRHIPTTFRSLWTGESKKTILKVLLGIAISFPMLLVVVPLLISSDLAFSGFADKFFTDFFEGIIKIVVGLIISAFVMAYIFGIKKRELKLAEEKPFYGVDNTVVVTFLSVISICYMAYLFSQLAYFFSAFKGFLPEDYTFNVAEYARRGFFEMSTIAAINLMVIFAVLLLSRKNERNLIGVASRLLCTFVGIFTLTIIATAISKMVLYIGEFGMTVLRLTTSAFMVFLAVVFLSLMLRLFVPNVSVLKTALVTAGILLTLLGTVNVNRVVATYNYEAYKSGKLDELDVWTIYELGDEGVPVLVRIAEEQKGENKRAAEERIINAFQDLYEYETKHNGKRVVYVKGERRYNGIDEFRISRHAAYEALEEYIEDHPLLFK